MILDPCEYEVYYTLWPVISYLLMNIIVKIIFSHFYMNFFIKMIISFIYFRAYRKKIQGNRIVLMKKLPLTHNAAIQHIKRTYYQVKYIKI